MSLWGLAWLRCMQNVGAWRILTECSTRCQSSCNVVAWNPMLSGPVKCGQGQKAPELFQQMQQEGVRANSVTFVAVLNACSSVVVIDKGRSAHEQIIQSG